MLENNKLNIEVVDAVLTISKLCSVTNVIYSVSIDTEEWSNILLKENYSPADFTVEDVTFLRTGITPAEQEEFLYNTPDLKDF